MQLSVNEGVPLQWMRSGAAGPGLTQALLQGGIHFQVSGSNQEEVLYNVIERLPLPEEVDRGLLWQVWMSQQSLEPTPLLNGLALPQPRSPVVLPVQRPLLALCFLKQAVSFPEAQRGAEQHEQGPRYWCESTAPATRPAGSSIHTLFALICPNLKVHMNLLTRLTALLGDPGFRELIRDRGSSAAILTRCHLIEGPIEEATQQRPAEVGGCHSL